MNLDINFSTPTQSIIISNDDPSYNARMYNIKEN
jgi:hypothetical protein